MSSRDAPRPRRSPHSRSAAWRTRSRVDDPAGRRFRWGTGRFDLPVGKARKPRVMATSLRSLNDRPLTAVVRLTREHGVACLRTSECRALPLPASAFATALLTRSAVERPLRRPRAMYPGQVRVATKRDQEARDKMRKAKGLLSIVAGLVLMFQAGTSVAYADDSKQKATAKTDDKAQVSAKAETKSSTQAKASVSAGARI